MTGATSAVDRIRTERVVATLRDVPDAERMVTALVAGGIRVVEAEARRLVPIVRGG